MRSLRNIYAVMRREMQRIWAYKPYFMLLTVLPIVSFLFFTAIFESGIPHKLPIAVLDEDHSVLSRKLTDMIDAAPEAEVRYEITDIDEGERLMREGKVHAIVQIPSFFEKNILSNTPAHVEGYISGDNVLTNGLISKDLLTTVTTFGTGIQLQILMKQGLTEKQAMAQAMPVRFDKHVLFNPYTNYGYYLSPSFMPMMIMIFVVLATVFAIGSELRYSTAREWIEAAEGSLFRAMTGKLLPVFMSMTLMALLMFFLLFDVINVPLNGSFTILFVGCVVFIVSYMGISIFIIGLTADMRLAMSLGGGYSVMAFSLSGLTFPVMAMFKGIQLFSYIFPFTYFTDMIVDQALRGAPAAYSIPDLCCMAAFQILPLLVLPRLRRIALDSSYWGKM